MVTESIADLLIPNLGLGEIDKSNVLPGAHDWLKSDKGWPLHALYCNAHCPLPSGGTKFLNPPPHV